MTLTSARLALNETTLHLVIGPEPGSNSWVVQRNLHFKTRAARWRHLEQATTVLLEIIEDKEHRPKGPDAWKQVAVLIRERMETAVVWVKCKCGKWTDMTDMCPRCLEERDKEEWLSERGNG